MVLTYYSTMQFYVNILYNTSCNIMGKLCQVVSQAKTFPKKIFINLKVINTHEIKNQDVFPSSRVEIPTFLLICLNLNQIVNYL